MWEIKLVVTASLLCQLGAAAVAIYLIRLTGRWSGWALLAAAMLLQTIRRALELATAASISQTNTAGRLSDWAGLVISILLLMGLVYLLPLFRGLRKSKEDLRDANRKLLSVRENERRTLATELHDSLGHRLFALQLDLERAASTASKNADHPLAEMLFQATRQCGSVMNEVRQICHGLYPPTLEALGLVETLKQLATEYRSAVRIEVHCDDNIEGLRFSREVEIACYRVAQEAVTNAARHGQASAMSLNLSYDEGMLILTVEDNGTGFDPRKVSGRGLGLSSMRDRVTALGGDVHIFSRPGRTQIVLLIPSRAKANVER